MEEEGALSGYRVLELAGPMGHCCGKLLADMGADVVKVERPGGDDARRIGPFKDDLPHPEQSLYFHYYNTNKRSITLNLETRAGARLFQQLAARADVVLESFKPGTMEEWELDYATLSGINPGLVMTSITGFGQKGPYRDYEATDLVGFAMSGLMYLNGDPDDAPVVGPGQQAYDLACTHAALGTLVALYNRLLSGRGQHVEVSVRECLAIEEHMISRYSQDGHNIRREGSQHGASAPGRIYPCKDGFAYLSSAGRPDARNWRVFLDWMGTPEALSDPVWDEPTFRRENVDVIDAFVREFALEYDRVRLIEEAQERHLPCLMVLTPQEFIKHPHTQARGYFVETEHPLLGKHLFPGAPVKFSESPWRIRRFAPLLGEHNAEIFGEELGLSGADLVVLRAQGVI